MPGTTFANIPHYQPPPATQAELEWADLAVIDLSKARTPEGRAEVAKQATDAMRNVGFFYVINHGFSPEETERFFDIADVPFSQVSDDEKMQYTANIKDSGSYQGYKPRSYNHIDNGVLDSNEHYNLNKDITKKEHPTALRPVLNEITSFAQFNHFEVLHELLRLLAIGFELPENAFVDMHQYDAVGESWVRFMKYYPRPEDDETKTKGVWFKGHTDHGSVTILWSQPVSGLQILSPDGKWRWVRHIDNALVINAGDMLESLSGGFYKATIHRVVQPPPDQRQHTRVGLFYFALPDDDVKLSPMKSPVLEREGIKRRFKEGSEPLVEEWRRARTSAYGQTVLKQGKDAGVEEEIINGVTVKHYN